MTKVQSLAEYLGTADRPDAPSADLASLTGKQFSVAVLDSLEFRSYIVNGLILGTVPAAVLCRLMDHAWGKPPERLEHTGRDGQPIACITEVRRVIVHVNDTQDDDREREVERVH